MIRQIIKVLKYDFYNDCFNTLSYKKNKIENQVQLHLMKSGYIKTILMDIHTLNQPKNYWNFLISLKNKTKKKL